ncbi:VAMP-like protein YKT61 [Nymphaea colorata]|nr:VAMP-like protein YKT61 [Nymphaea colorata]
MRIISLHVLKWAEENSFFLSSAYDLGFVSWYQRPFYKETVNFGARTAAKWFEVEDEDLKWGKLEELLKKYQDPKEVDKLEKLKDELKQVEEICHKNLNDLLKRGEDLDKLMEKSKDVSNLSLDFYKQAKKANSRCCSLS